MKEKIPRFLLIEILVVVALIIILAAITIVAINPGKIFKDSRNAERSAEVSELLNAISQYTSEEGHNIADFGTIASCTGTPSASNIGTGTNEIDLGTILVDEYIVEIPVDPSITSGTDTGYDICITDSGRVQIEAPLAEDKEIVVKR